MQLGEAQSLLLGMLIKMAHCINWLGRMGGSCDILVGQTDLLTSVSNVNSSAEISSRGKLQLGEFVPVTRFPHVVNVKCSR